MKTAETIEICERWFAHIDGQRQRSVEMQRAAKMARNGQQEEAQRLVRQIDNTPRVFDGATLEPAVRHLVRHAQGKSDVDA